MCFKEPQWKNYYWIDLFKFCSQFVHEHEGSMLAQVKYFTAPPQNALKRSKQSAFLNANTLVNGSLFSSYSGHYSKKEVECFAECKKTFTVLEEKCTDVSLALNIVMDYVENIVDTIVLVTADSDQIPTIKMLKAKFPSKKLKVYFPPCRNSTEIRKHIGQVVFLENHEDKFMAAKMPGEVTDGNKKYIRPPEWSAKSI